VRGREREELLWGKKKDGRSADGEKEGGLRKKKVLNRGEKMGELDRRSIKGNRRRNGRLLDPIIRVPSRKVADGVMGGTSSPFSMLL